MKTATKPKKEVPSTARLTHYPRVSQQDANKEFLKEIGLTATNSHVNQFVRIMDGILDGPSRSFVFTHVVRQCKAILEMEYSEIQELFIRWLKVMERLQKVEPLEGCY